MPAERAPADPDRFKEASDWLRGRVAVTRDEWDRMRVEARRQAFTFAGTSQLEVVQTVLDEIQRSLDKGTPIDAFRKSVKAKLAKQFGRATAKDVVEGHATTLTTAYINANQTALNTGRYWQMSKPEVTRALPYRMYDSVRDSSTTEICIALDKTVRPHDDPWWLTHFPPMHHRCRSTVRALTERMAKARGGISREAPRPQIPGDWGLAPPLRAGSVWEPELANYQPDAAREYSRKQNSMRQREAAGTRRVPRKSKRIG